MGRVNPHWPAGPAAFSRASPSTFDFTLLIVEDDIAVRTSVSRLLRQAGYPVQTATDAAAHVQELALPALRTYEGGVKPQGTIANAVDQLPATGTRQGYQVLADLVVNGATLGGATYSLPFAAARNPATPLQVTGVTEVWH